MNHKDFISQLTEQTNVNAKEANRLSQVLTDTMASILDDGDAIAIQGFGLFEVKKKMERIVVNPSSKQRMLVPPILVVSFKPSATLKERTTKA